MTVWCSCAECHPEWHFGPQEPADPPHEKSGFVPRGGALCFQREDGSWVFANPREPMYSTVTMCATHFWRDGCWVAIDQGAAS